MRATRAPLAPTLGARGARESPHAGADARVALIGSPTDGWFMAAVEEDNEGDDRFHALTPVTDSPDAALAAWAPQVPPRQVAAIATSQSSTLSAEGIARMPAVAALTTQVLSLDGEVVLDAHGDAFVPNEDPTWDGWDGWEVVDADGPVDEDDEIDVGPMAVVTGSLTMARGDVRVEVQWSEGDGWWIERAWQVEPGAS